MKKKRVLIFVVTVMFWCLNLVPTNALEKSILMNNKEFSEKIIEVAKNYKTLYIMGCFGAPMTDENKDIYTKNHEYNTEAFREKMIREASSDTFGFDCVNLIKGILWGWNGDKNEKYGGAIYNSNDVVDTNANGMIDICEDVSDDFSNIEIGEVVWLKGHIGVYIGKGLVVECTPRWDNGVQITAMNKSIKGFHMRTWNKHGKLPWVDYIKKDSKVCVKDKGSDIIKKEKLEVKIESDVKSENKVL